MCLRVTLQESAERHTTEEGWNKQDVSDEEIRKEQQ
jgi:hypothetical protein